MIKIYDYHETLRFRDTFLFLMRLCPNGKLTKKKERKKEKEREIFRSSW